MVNLIANSSDPGIDLDQYVDSAITTQNLAFSEESFDPEAFLESVFGPETKTRSNSEIVESSVSLMLNILSNIHLNFSSNFY